VQNGAIMAVYVFIVVILYMVLSTPFNSIIGDFEDLNMSNSDSEVEAGSSQVGTVFNMVFAGLVLVPLIWFVFWCFHREPDWRDRF